MQTRRFIEPQMELHLVLQQADNRLVVMDPDADRADPKARVDRDRVQGVDRRVVRAEDQAWGLPAAS